GLADECGWFGRYLVRLEGPGRQGEQLGADQRRREVRGAVSFLWPGEAGVRQDLESAGHRTDRGPMSAGRDAMKPNRRETISLLAGAPPVALGVLSVGAASQVSAEDAKPAA